MNKDKVIEIFISIDDFCKDLDPFTLKTQLLGTNTKLRRRKCRMSLSERITIYICFHLSSHTNFKKYYNVDDRDMKILKVMSKEVFGKLFADRRYISKKLADFLWNDGVELI